MQPDVGVANWKQLERLGNGAFGLVFKVLNEDTNKEYAAKISKGSGHSNDLLLDEIKVHSRLIHPNIIQYITSFEMLECGGGSIVQAAPNPSNCICMILEMADNGTLYTKSITRATRKLQIFRKYARGVVGALIYLKEQGIVHRDIKLENVLIDGGVVKLADFGFACFVEKSCKTRDRVGTPLYFAPEVIKESHYSFQTDVWALGVVFYHMITGKFPFNANTMPELSVKILNGYREPFKSDVYHSLGVMFLQDPEQRIKIEHVLHLHVFNESQDVPEEFLQAKVEFGDGTRDAFYMYLAARNPDQPAMPLNEFNDYYDRLY